MSFPKKIGFDDSFDVTKCLQQIEMPKICHFRKNFGFDDSVHVTKCLQQIEMPDLLDVCA